MGGVCLALRWHSFANNVAISQGTVSTWLRLGGLGPCGGFTQCPTISTALTSTLRGAPVYYGKKMPGAWWEKGKTRAQYTPAHHPDKIFTPTHHRWWRWIMIMSKSEKNRIPYESRCGGPWFQHSLVIYLYWVRTDELGEYEQKGLVPACSGYLYWCILDELGEIEKKGLVPVCSGYLYRRRFDELGEHEKKG